MIKFNYSNDKTGLAVANALAFVDKITLDNTGSQMSGDVFIYSPVAEPVYASPIEIISYATIPYIMINEDETLTPNAREQFYAYIMANDLRFVDGEMYTPE